jgi:glycine betaine catabolism A
MAMRPSTLPGAFYRSEEIYRQEIERIFCEHWLCIGRADQIPEPGDYFVQRVGEESLLIVRGQDGVARAFYNVCRHRGSQLCTDASGHYPSSISCPYHAWTYALDGRLIGAPHMRGVSGFDASEYSLYAAALETWHGFLFLNLAKTPEPLAERFVPFTEKLACWELAGLRPARRIEYTIRANWKLLFENFSECYHCPLVHPELNALSNYRSGFNDFVEGIFLGGPMEMNRKGTSLTMSGNRCGPVVGRVAGEDLDRIYYYTLFPNLLLSLHPDYVMFHTLWPQAPDRTDVVCEWLFDPAAFEQAGFDPDDAVAFWDRTNRQDWRICEGVQQGIRSRAYTPGPAGSGVEDLLPAFHRELLAALGSVTEPPNAE